ncbi:MAG: transcription termination/antitermination protein NusA [Bacteroidales bacterium]|jgi:N utilization substance protein A|nr:transcription termination/antitermination protein NusA [Bacteroidales bacterium]MBQ1637502.1 transcription termination/antitermination protein NusA [Bacteroidales bacterium]MBQ1680020.1 transcription termination/antitermination protein NusA [Bacteroidales bacterium]MBQ1753405.1 transcription termination/antitermination protein NusA [Bacteroidales bacterium]MBQ1830783.1 transcription termination/antitermination protein NusA [Bacteroidales bacterium]
MEVNLISTFAEFKELKNIDRPTLMSVLEDIFRTQLARMYGDADNFDIIINIDKGDISIIRNRTVVETVEDPNKEISLEEVRKIDDSYEVGEEYAEEVPMSSFGRRGILNLRQNLSSRITDIEKANLYNKYREKVGEILVGEVYQAWKKEVLVMDEDGNELVLPKTEQIPSDFFRKGDTVKAVIISVEMKNNTPIITLSRTSNLFLERLFEQEVPEIFDGLITIKKVVRMPGERAKVAVESYDDRIDPVGACVGVKGSRIHGIVRELRGENIDIINWTTNTQLLVQRALSPAKISSIRIDEASKSIHIDLESSELALAIGRGGSNILLAEQLSGYKIDVYRLGDQGQEDEEDVLLDDFADEIDGWIIEALKKIGCDTAKSVLALSTEEVMQRADLEEETVLDVQRILQAEFEN